MDDNGNIRGLGLRMEYGLLPWDEAACGFPVAQIRSMVIMDDAKVGREFVEFEHWRREYRVGLVSCRLPEDALRESMFLETRRFRFLEMVIEPRANISQLPVCHEPRVQILPADEADLPGIQQIARTAFRTDRFHMDHRLPSDCASARYSRWVESAFRHPSQRLFKAEDSGRLLAFFLIEEEAQRRVSYWHLHAVSPAFQGQGWGRRIWRAMIERCRVLSMKEINTTISLRNPAVLNLYARLGFRFAHPQMTLHWTAIDHD